MFRAAIVVAFLIHGYWTYESYLAHGYAGYFPPFAQVNTTQIFSDLVVSLQVLNVFIYRDIQRRGWSLWWLAAVMVGEFFSGSFAALLYGLIAGPPPAPARDETALAQSKSLA